MYSTYQINYFLTWNCQDFLFPFKLLLQVGPSFASDGSICQWIQINSSKFSNDDLPLMGCSPVVSILFHQPTENPNNRVSYLATRPVHCLRHNFEEFCRNTSAVQGLWRINAFKKHCRKKKRKRRGFGEERRPRRLKRTQQCSKSISLLPIDC